MSFDDRLKKLESMRGARFGIISEVDFTQSADWNRKRFNPAVRVLLEENSEKPIEVTCRVSAKGAFKDSGLWWPPEKDQVAVVVFQTDLSTGSVIDYFWSDEQSDTPSEATPENVVMKYRGHTIIIDGKAGDGGISLRTASGIEIDAQDKSGDQKISITHPSGTNVEIDNSGNVSLECVGNLEAGIDGNTEITIGGDLETIVIGNVDADIGGNASISVGGDLDVQVAGRSLINSGGVNELRSAAEILLKTASAATGMLTQATHPVCMLMGTPNGASATVKGSS